RGLEIAWCSGNQTDLEARWSSEGATCVSKLRVLYMKDPQFSDWPVALKSVCGNDGKDECPSLDEWKANAVRCHVGDETSELQQCAPSSGPPCAQGNLESYIVSNVVAQ